MSTVAMTRIRDMLVNVSDCRSSFQKAVNEYLTYKRGEACDKEGADHQIPPNDAMPHDGTCLTRCSRHFSSVWNSCFFKVQRGKGLVALPHKIAAENSTSQAKLFHARIEFIFSMHAFLSAKRRTIPVDVYALTTA